MTHLFTVEQILKNTNDDELFCLFGEFLNRLIEKNNFLVKANLINPKEKRIVFLDKDKFDVIKEMKSNE